MEAKEGQVWVSLIHNDTHLILVEASGMFPYYWHTRHFVTGVEVKGLIHSASLRNDYVLQSHWLANKEIREWLNET